MVRMTPEQFTQRAARLKQAWEETNSTPERQAQLAADDDMRAGHARYARETRLIGMGIPLIFAHDILSEKFQPNELDQKLDEFDGGLRSILILAGGVGTMKTSAACRWLDRAGGRFFTAHDVAHASTLEGSWDKLLNSAHLVIDDLGAERETASGWVIEKVRAILEKRHSMGTPLVITTNLSKPVFVRRYGDDGGRLVDRLKQCGEWFDVPVFQSMRQRPEAT